MNIDPFLLYLILQLDKIFVGLIFIVIFLLVSIYISIEIKNNFKIGYQVIALIISFFLLIFLPSTKSAAAIYIIPKVVNNEAFTNEASELYKLFKDKIFQDYIVEPELPEK